ncbi:MAG: ribbon-helix-helix protein, CopG family [Caldilineaceae bacterium]|nr:ribbon-helix-helix protein, CopG family [Caldilineaceae bacterium]
MADRVARRRGMSRSQLFAVALREYLAAHAHEGLTERINAVCEKVDTALDPALRRSQLGLLHREEW